ncbi:MAG: hypothetical protein ACX938_03795 [Roseivivax sp.]
MADAIRLVAEPLDVRAPGAEKVLNYDQVHWRSLPILTVPIFSVKERFPASVFMEVLRDE